MEGKVQTKYKKIFSILIIIFTILISNFLFIPITKSQEPTVPAPTDDQSQVLQQKLDNLQLDLVGPANNDPNHSGLKQYVDRVSMGVAGALSVDEMSAIVKSAGTKVNAVRADLLELAKLGYPTEDLKIKFDSMTKYINDINFVTKDPPYEMNPITNGGTIDWDKYKNDKNYQTQIDNGEEPMNATRQQDSGTQKVNLSIKKCKTACIESLKDFLSEWKWLQEPVCAAQCSILDLLSKIVAFALGFALGGAGIQL